MENGVLGNIQVQAGDGIFPDNGSLLVLFDSLYLLFQKCLQKLVTSDIVLLHVLANVLIILPAVIDRLVTTSMVIFIFKPRSDLINDFVDNLVRFRIDRIELACSWFISISVTPIVGRIKIELLGTSTVL